jgi:hypothetical protein
MRASLWLASALTAALVLGGVAHGQAPDTKKKDTADSDKSAAKKDTKKKDGKEFFKGQKGFEKGKGRKGKGGKGRGFGAGLSEDQIVERFMKFDKNNDGKITKDELPERLQFLLDKAGKSKEGALTRDDVKKLVANFKEGKGREFAQLFGRGKGGFGKDGFGKGGFGGFGKGGFGGKGPFGEGGDARLLEGLKLTGKTKEKAEAILKEHHKDVRHLLQMARSDLLVKMKDVLNEQQYKQLKEELERRPAGGPPPGPGAGKTAELERRLDQTLKQFTQLQKQLEELRRELKQR